MTNLQYAAQQTFGPKVNLPRRMKADLIDGLIGTVLFVLPLLTADALVDKVPDAVVRFGILGWPIGIAYVLFRDVWGNGTSWGKRFMGLKIINTNTGESSTKARVLVRNIVDLIPVVNTIDFWVACADKHGQKYMDKLLDTQITENEDTVSAV